MSKIVFHIDVNSAYLSWEAAYRLQMGSAIDLRKIPSVVGGDREKRHGIVLAKSIPAKKYKIKTGESTYSALEKCPSLKIVSPNYERYIGASNAMVELVNEYSPKIQRYSIDEVFLDYSNGDRPFIEVASEIKDRIEKELGFTVNIGIGPNKLLAKMASDFKKPNQIHLLFKKDIKEKMWPLPVEDLFMVGSRTKKKLNDRSIYKIGELAKLDKEFVHSWLKKPGLVVLNYANGIENSPVRTDATIIKSVGNSTTTAFDVKTNKEAYLVLLGLSEMVGLRIRGLNMCGYVVSVSIRNHLFHSYSHQRKLMTPTDSTKSIFYTAKELFDEVWNKEPIRHFSINLSELVSNDFFQLSFLDKEDKNERIVDKVIDKLRDRFGQNCIQRSCFLYSGIDPVIGGVVKEDSYPMMSSIL